MGAADLASLGSGLCCGVAVSDIYLGNEAAKTTEQTAGRIHVFDAHVSHRQGERAVGLCTCAEF